MQPPTTAVLLRGVVTFLLGALVAVLGTVMHRAIPPWGLVLCVVLVLVALLTARAWGGWVTYVAGVGGLFLAGQLLAGEGPGGDVLVPGTDLWGWGWILGAVLAVVAVALVPRRFVQDDPAPGGTPAAGTGPSAP